MGYTGAYDGWLPTCRQKVGNAHLYWPRILSDFTNVKINCGTSGGVDLDEARGTIYVCPSDEEFNDAAASDLWAPSSFGTNRANFIDADLDRPKFKVSKVRKTSDSSYFMDMNSIWYAGFNEGYWNTFWNPVHNRGMNTLYVDGHVDLTTVNGIETNPNDVFWDWTD